MGIFDTKCAQCGSKEHATDDCPHGIFSSDKCGQCGSKEHATDDCPHGIFSGDKCGQCGSTEHATADCPHGIFSGDKCSHCGSNNHSTEQCPQLNSSVYENSEHGGVMNWLADKGAIVGGVFGAIAGFSTAMDSADGISGYLMFTAFGAFLGAGMGAVMAALLPWAIGAAILMFILKACGMGS